MVAHGDASKDWRREAGKANDDCEGKKAGDDGPVVGGVELRYELLKVCEVALGRPS